VAVSALLYDAAGHDDEVDVTRETVEVLNDDQLLWIDIEATGVVEAGPFLEPLGISDRIIERVADLERPPYLDNYPDSFAFAIDAPDDADIGSGGERGVQLGFVVGKRWLLTIHAEPVEYLAAFKAQDKGETKIGQLSPALLAASLLDWHLTQYFAQVAEIETQVDKLDAAILADGTQRQVLDRIVAIRARVSRLRAQLAAQRPIFYGFGRPDFTLNFDDAARRAFGDLALRFDRAVDEVERTREVVVVSFELFTSMTTQKTNELVKALTFLTALIGFCALVAGLLGMNFELPIFKAGTGGFEAVTGAMLVLFVVSLFVAKWRQWL
jgi:magnesium transporter